MQFKVQYLKSNISVSVYIATDSKLTVYLRV